MRGKSLRLILPTFEPRNPEEGNADNLPKIVT
jgi:hypothetical protein